MFGGHVVVTSPYCMLCLLRRQLKCSLPGCTPIVLQQQGMVQQMPTSCREYKNSHCNTGKQLESHPDVKFADKHAMAASTSAILTKHCATNADTVSKRTANKTHASDVYTLAANS